MDGCPCYQASNIQSNNHNPPLDIRYSRYPELIVSDNGTPFTSQEFRAFTQSNGIRHNTSAPYHPATNGLAERAVQTVKTFSRKTTEGSLEDRLSRFLFLYRITPHSTTGSSPAQLLFGRQPRSRLDLLRPDLQSKVQQQQERQKTNKDNKAPLRSFSVDDVADLPTRNTWLPGTVTKVLGSRSYEILLSDNRTIRRHLDHIRPNYDSTESNTNAEVPTDWVPTSTDTDTPSTDTPTPTPHSTGSSPVRSSPPLPLRRSGRNIRPPDRYADHCSS